MNLVFISHNSSILQRHSADSCVLKIAFEIMLNSYTVLELLFVAFNVSFYCHIFLVSSVFTQGRTKTDINILKQEYSIILTEIRHDAATVSC